jgi:hypothetical protein
MLEVMEVVQIRLHAVYAAFDLGADIVKVFGIQ